MNLFTSCFYLVRVSTLSLVVAHALARKPHGRQMQQKRGTGTGVARPGKGETSFWGSI